MKFQSLAALVFVCAGCLIGSPASAQEPEDAFESARFRLGPVRLTPGLRITSLGVDSNIFNEPDNPKSDTTAAIGPAVEMWMRPFGTRFSGKFGGQYLYFKEFNNQRSWNTANEALWEIPLSRLTPFIGGTLVNSSDRHGYEIDSRARRHDDSYTVGSGLQFSGKTTMVVSFRRATAEYDDDEDNVTLGRELAAALNRREDLTKMQLRYAVTPLTTFVLDADFGRDRFKITNLRDADSVRVMPGFELKPSALIAGRAFVGYRQFNPLNTNLPDYRGLVTAVDVTYIKGSTRFQTRAERDIAYSFQTVRPYYVLTDLGLTVTQRMMSAWEFLGRAGHQRLAYRQLTSAGAIVGAGEPDRGYVVGAGAAYRLGEALRLGVDANYYTRRSKIEGRRDYEGLRVFGSIIYGIQK